MITCAQTYRYVCAQFHDVVMSVHILPVRAVQHFAPLPKVKKPFAHLWHGDERNFEMKEMSEAIKDGMVEDRL